MNHELFMHRCLQLASLGMPAAKPNPLVGSVVVHQNKIIGEGYHQKYGEAHAEVNAINAVSDKSLLKDSIIYVNLEPCAHFGKTPPCADLIIKMGIPKVIIGCTDPFSEVSGKGIQRLKDAGIDVITDILKNESLWINRRFFTFHQKKRPYILLKWAQSQDGFLDKLRDQGEQGVNWITNPKTKQLVHKWRAEEDAILVGKGTWNTDKPQLNVREFEGPSPVRIILSTNKDSLLPETEPNDIVFGGELKQLMQLCFDKGIQSILVEGGKETLQRFIDEELWDEARVFTGGVNFSAGLAAPTLKGAKFLNKTELNGGDLLTIYYKE